MHLANNTRVAIHGFADLKVNAFDNFTNSIAFSREHWLRRQLNGPVDTGIEASQ